MAVYLGTNKVSMTGLTDLSGASIINNQNKTVSASTSQQTITADSGYTGLGTVTVNAATLQTLPITENGTYTPSSGYYGIGTVNVNVPQGSTINNQNKTVTPTTSQQSITADSGYTGLGTVTVNAMPTGTAGTPTATKGTVSNHSVSVTPSVTNQTGYITGSTKTGTAVTVSASELVSGSETKTANGTYDVTNLAELVVNVSGGSGSSMQIGEADATSTTASISFTGLPSEPTSFFISFVGGSSIGLPTGTPYTTIDVVYDGTTDFGNIATNITNAQASYSTNFSHSYSNGTLTVTGTESNFIGHYLMLYTYGGSTSDIHTKDVQVGSGVTSITFTELESEPTYWSCAFKSNFGTSSGYQRTIATAYGYDTFGSILNGYNMSTVVGCSTTAWTASYNNGSLTITSQGTNQGGYFHQPGYYQLTYAYDDGSGSGGSSITTESLSVTTNGTYTAPSGKAYTPVYVNVPTGSTINNQNKTVTPTTSQQSVTADSGYTGLGTVTVNAIPNTYVQPTTTIGATTYRASTSSQTISAGTYHSAAATIAAVSQTNLTAANIKSGTTITISNGQSNLWSVTGTYEGSGSGSGDAMQIATSSKTLTATASSISFTGLSGQPTSFAITSAANVSTNTTGVAEVVYDGTNVIGQTITTQVTYDDSSFSQSYSNGTLTVSSTSANFQANEYTLVYTYGGSSSNIDTASQAVGSGATSVTFTGLSDEPDYFACIFTGGFSTSSGYQRVIGVVYDGDTTYGMAMDSAAKPQTSWSYTYNNGSLTITSSGTNNGGYFHMDGTIPYYLVYATGAGESSGNYQTKSVTYTPSTTQQTATIQADTGYDALKKVNITVNAMTSMTLPTASSATSSGTLKATITPTSSAQYLNIPVGYNSTAQYYTISAASGGGSASIGSKTLTPSNRPTSIQFTSMSGSPKAFMLRCTAAMSRSSNSSYYYVAHIRYNGTNTYGNCWRMSNGNWTNITSGYSFSYSGTTLTITSSGSTTTSPGCFYPGEYELVYIY